MVVPPGPGEMLICRYWGYGVRRQTKETRARAATLARERRLSDPALTRSIAAKFDRTRPAHGAYACPSWDGANLYVVFAYAYQPNVVVEADLGGCGFVDNGFGRGGFPPIGLRHRLERLAKLPRQ